MLLAHMDARSPRGRTVDGEPAPFTDRGRTPRAGEPRTYSAALASHHDAAGVPIHRGWAPLGARRRWMEPFVLVLLAGGGAHGYAITAQLEEMGITGGSVDVGQVYRTLRDLEAAGHVTSSWSTESVGPQRRDYELTEAGYLAIDEWAAVMKERLRLIAEFNARYLDAVAAPRGSHRSGEDDRDAVRE
jgi:PadR family transcriptional regulator, regulatory protein PadR